jgi:hypothetical protein
MTELILRLLRRAVAQDDGTLETTTLWGTRQALKEDALPAAFLEFGEGGFTLKT